MTSSAAFRPSRQFRLFQKELRETLRDRRTILTLVLMPLLVYPLLGVTFQKFFVTQVATQNVAEYLLAFDDERTALEFRDLFSEGNQLLGRELSPSQPLPVKPGERPDPKLRFIFPEEGHSAQLETMLSENQADLGIRLTADEQNSRREVELLLRSGSPVSREAAGFVKERLQAVNDRFVNLYLERQPNPSRLPLAWSTASVAVTESNEFSLATLVPLVLILMTVTGAVYPAIDLTAGERERGTLEPLMAAPVSRSQVLVAKYLAVLTVALMTALVNLSAMVATAYGTGLERMLFGSAGLSVQLIALMLLLLTVFAGFFSAVILAITSIARSFKEAQAYLIPLMMLSMAPGVLALMPGLEMTAAIALTPLVNMVVLSRDLLDGRAEPLWLLLVIGSSAGYAGIALTIAARIFGTDSVLYGSAGSWSDLWTVPDVERPLPKFSQGWLAVGVLFPAFVLLSGVPGRFGELGLSQRLLVSALLTTLLFAIWPVALCRVTRVHLRTGLGLVSANALAFLAAVIAGLSLWPFAYELEVWTLSTERMRSLVELFKGFETELQQVPIVWKLLTLAVVPAVCEELFFRGYLFRALRTIWSGAATIVVTAALFGLFHVLVRDALLIERFLPTALMGLALGWVAERSGSTLPGILLHVIHNASLLLLPVWSPLFGSLFETTERQHLPASWLMLSGLGVLTAAVLLWWNRPASTTPGRVVEPDVAAGERGVQQV